MPEKVSEELLKRRERSRKWNAEHKEQRKRYMEENAEKIKSYKLQWREKNQEKIRLKAKEYREKNRDKIKDRMLRFDHGLSLDEYKVMLQNQDNKCAICALEFNDQYKNTKAHVDHDHSTNKIRALLCHSCNIGIGVFKDSPNLLTKAVKYLESY